MLLITLAEMVREILGREVDSVLLSWMIEACHEHAVETTGEAASDVKLMYLTRTKARIIAESTNIRNHVAVLRKAMPVSARHKGNSGYDMRAIAEDPELDEAAKRQVEGMIESLGRFKAAGLW